MDQPGVYQLHLYLPKTARLKVGKLGTFLFPPGRYRYTGSALSGLERRLARHYRREKRLHWHIDYLLRHARIEAVTVLPTTRVEHPSANERQRGEHARKSGACGGALSEQRLECELNRETLRQGHRPEGGPARVIAPRFGSSDCRCPTHLLYLGERDTMGRR